MRSIRGVPGDDLTEAVPAFLTMLPMPLTFSVATGLALGFISYALIELLAGRGREPSVLVYVLAALFVWRYSYLGAG
jgi:adenine/guanine/hypoxanthine permease